jgi:transcriptional regulator with XRE-family HTH domain
MTTVKIGQRLRYCRINNNLTGREVATKLNISAPQVSQYENGTHSPSYDILIALSNIYNVSLDYIITGKHILSNDLNSDDFKLLQKFKRVSVNTQKIIINILENELK